MGRRATNPNFNTSRQFEMIQTTSQTSNRLDKKPANWILSLKKLVSAMLCHPVVGRALAVIYQNIIPNYDCRIDTSDPSISPIMKAAIFWRGYEGAEIRYIRRFIDDQFDIIELGASNGISSAHLAKKTEGRRRLFCIEANPSLRDSITRNIKLNAPNSHFFVENYLIDYPENHATSSVFHISNDPLTSNLDARKTNYSSTRMVQIIRLSEFLNKHEITEFVLVSDIEGGECGFIFEDFEALRLCRLLVIELHACYYKNNPISVEQLIDAIQSLHHFQLVERYGGVAVFQK